MTTTSILILIAFLGALTTWTIATVRGLHQPMVFALLLGAPLPPLGIAAALLANTAEIPDDVPPENI